MSKQLASPETVQETDQPAQTGNQNGATSNAEQQQKLHDEQYKANYQDALGNYLGEKIYGAVSKEITLDKMSGYANKIVESLLKSGLSGIGGDTISKEAQDGLTKIFADVLKPYVDQFMQSDTGKDLVGKLQGAVGAHPYAVVSIALAAAVGAVLADVDIPTLKQKFSLGKGFSGNVEANLGSLRNIALGAAKLTLEHQKGLLSSSVSIEKNKEGAVSGTISEKYGTDTRNIKGSVTIGQDGIQAYGLEGLYSFNDKTSIQGSVSGSTLEKPPKMSLQLKTKQGDFTHTGQLQYNAGTGVLDASYSGASDQLKYALGMGGNTQTGQFTNMHAGMEYSPQKGDVYSAKYDNKFGANSEFMGGDQRLQLMAQKRFGDLSLRGSQQFDYSRDKGLRSNSEILGAYHMNNDLSLIGGAGYNYDGKESSVIPKVGVQYKDVPVVLQYDTNKREMSVGVVLKF